MYRGEIWWANLPDPKGSEPGYRRPVLIIQDDLFNQSPINTVIVVIITSNTQLAEAPGNVLLPSKVSGLSRDSVANVSQIFTVDKVFLTERIGSLPDYLQEEVDDGLRMVLYL
ncbi:MAG: type II toxin-antitoxin system PemK/MazF family toxin [Moorea sp. SIO3I7]|nr:type II toxin-antitoxin system PemK/MazF family toxin [Moorena sp. SIO3I7]NEO08485.1 type II toxin-antitoxin system PemK/MazF family toxin [Moorena sp. SIO3I8]NEO23374.1 type II toxin-antitoxin system PemK/MazF family toxin [Moorena sp. SIO4A5]NEO66914.1 type II toxin-antitoxin system PemK/MazF family toxin [Moorena sp. SIO4G2]NEO74820.1 type II toxin-antitoxin system PemK/MazF family toxin [Moorena sp. SIO4G3]NEP25850.1 type II toxin-antitoxin system PemK/MazF family toxin [Moorena sp. SIO